MTSPELEPSVSVVICTYNRAGLLPRVLASLAAQQGAPSFEVVVIDNASTDATAATVAAWADPRLNPRYVYEGTLGLAHARNRGMREGKAPVVAFIDDDCEADEHWLSALYETYVRERPVAVGGIVALQWEAPRPEWLTDVYLPYYSAIDNGPESRRIDLKPEQIICCNLLLSREAVAAVGGFNERLGRKGSNLMGNEENELLHRLINHGGVVWYEPAAVVRHHVPAKRLRIGWFLRRYMDQGRSDVIAQRFSVQDAPESALHYLVRSALWLGRVARIRNRKDLYSCLISVAYDGGRVYEKLRSLVRR